MFLSPFCSAFTVAIDSIIIRNRKAQRSMKRIDVVRQQRAIPLLNELLFSVIDAKPEDPLAYLIDALEKVATDVKQAKGRLAELVRSRKQLNETLTVAKRHHKPAGLTLLLHASGGNSGGAARHPLLHDLYHSDALLHCAPPPPEEGVSNQELPAAEGKASNVTSGIILPPLTTTAAVPSAVPQSPEKAKDFSNETGDDHPRRRPELRIESAVSSASRWDAQMNAAFKSPLPTDALQALYSAAEAIRGGLTAPPLSGIEVLLVSAVHATNSFTAVTPRSRSGAATPRASSGVNSVHVSPVRHHRTPAAAYPLLQFLIDSDTAMMHKVPGLVALMSAAAAESDSNAVDPQTGGKDAAYVNFQPLDYLRLACDVSSVAGHFSALEVLFQTTALSRRASSSVDNEGVATPPIVVAQDQRVVPETQNVAHSLAAVAAAASHPLPYLDFLVAASQQQRPGTTADPQSPSSQASTTTFSSSTNNITRLLQPFVDASPSSFPFLGRLLTIMRDDGDAGNASGSHAEASTPYLRLLAEIVEQHQSDGSLLRLLES
ncbi:Hypothetical protein, putative [Bodo saltans]|uniref:Uncharacterized protein n=1 Tax=Bodo saltans TaxID=75058 RepID=A0A0S4JS30_BODSA|nr:Hypothetical protein, putative [Bodo saltans]|eukprot:CUG92197.1 Hypothetical protein, putative [Bodo saltans]